MIQELIVHFMSSFSLAITKIDVLDDMDEIKVAVAYKLKGEKLEGFPGKFCII